MSWDLFDLHFHEDIGAVEAIWRQLEVDPQVSLHQSFDWCREWWPRAGGRVVIEGRIDGVTHCILPLEVTRSGPVRVGRFAGSQYSNLNTGVFSAAMRASSTMGRDFLNRLRIDGRRYLDVLVMERMALQWRGQGHPLAGLCPPVSSDPSFQLQLSASFHDTLQQLSAARRLKKHRASLRKLKELGGFEHVIGNEPDEAAALLEAFFIQKADRFKEQDLPDAFHDISVKDTFRRLVSQGTSNGHYSLQMHALRLKGPHDGCLVALAGLSRKGDHVICQFGSIDSTLAPHASPGDFLFHLIIERLCTENAALFDFGVGDQPYKRTWCNIESPQHNLVFPITLKGLLYSRVYPARQAVKRAVKNNERLYRVVQHFRAEVQKRSDRL